MKRTAMILVCFSFLFVFCLGVTMAQEKATKEECMAKAKEAAELIEKVGFEAAKDKLMDPKGPFVWKDSYVFVVDLKNSVMLAHGAYPKMVGKCMKGIRDANGKQFNYEMEKLAESPGEGWISYVWPKPGEKEPSPKITYVYRVPGQTLFVGSGIYQ